MTPKRPSWTDYLLGIAKCVARRSHDHQTQHGCVLAAPDHSILSTGTNGHCRGGKDDEGLPKNRPVDHSLEANANSKYPWMLHSEENALANANGQIKGTNATAYITGKSCFHCMQLLWQNGVRHIIEIDKYGWKKDELEAANRERFLRTYDMKVEQVTPDLSWLVDMVLEDPDLRPILDKKLAEKAACCND